jgi:hypothetical protein
MFPLLLLGDEQQRKRNNETVERIENKVEQRERERERESKRESERA